MPTQESHTAQYSLRSLFFVTLAVSVVLALWRATGSVFFLLLGAQASCVWVMYLDFHFSRDKFHYITGCAAIVALVLLSILFNITVLAFLLPWMFG